MGIFCNAKKQVTIPQEFHFATNERIPQAAAVVDLFDKVIIQMHQIIILLLVCAYIKSKIAYEL